MFPCRVISPVVRPSIPHALSAGAISFSSTSLKSIPSLTPKGRTMNARVTLISRLRSYRLKLVNPDTLKGSHDIERGWKMLRLYLLLRGNLSNAGEFIHVRGIIHFCDLREFVGRLFDIHNTIHTAFALLASCFGLLLIVKTLGPHCRQVLCEAELNSQHCKPIDSWVEAVEILGKASQIMLDGIGKVRRA